MEGLRAYRIGVTARGNFTAGAAAGSHDDRVHAFAYSNVLLPYETGGYLVLDGGDPRLG